MSGPRSIQSPKGTRDFYPEEMLRRRYITDAWRRTALRHGFDEIDGPVFEHRELYEKKSGEGILNEMFSVFSGKDPGQREAMERGEPAPFGLRPEFTPTLARMYAAKAKQLPNPCKWFCVSNFFRAERPQRGRLREFFQWNCDVVGGNARDSDAEIISVTLGGLANFGISSNRCVAKFSDRTTLGRLLKYAGVPEANQADAIALLDRRQDLPISQLYSRASEVHLDLNRFDSAVKSCFKAVMDEEQSPSLKSRSESFNVLDLFEAAPKILGRPIDEKRGLSEAELDQIFDSEEVEPIDSGQAEVVYSVAELILLARRLRNDNWGDWVAPDFSIVRGLAYYTGTVFEVIAEGERAVAGGGRYDNLIELFGGPPTPACGFGMGDVVLENLLNDHNLMPTGRDLVRALSEPMPVRPDVFIVTNGDEAAERQLVPTLAALRRGVLAEGQREPWDPNRYTVTPMHARRTYKTTKQLNKLKAAADAQHARLFVILESDERCTVQDLDGVAEERRDVPIAELNTIAAAMLKA